MFFSVIIPVYNVEKYLEKCLQSVATQTYKDFEAIIINDGSTDNSGLIAENFASKNNLFRVYHQKNSGLGAARNTGLSKASGKYLIFIDSDDWVEKNYFLEIRRLLQIEEYDIIRCGWIVEKFNQEEKILDTVEGKVNKYTFLREVLSDQKGCQVWKNVYRRLLWEYIVFPERLYEDLYVTHNIVNRSKTIYQIDGYYYHYVIREGNISNTLNPKKGKDIFEGFYNRYLFVVKNDMNEILPEILYKVYGNAIQAIHGSALIDDILEINHVNDIILKLNKSNNVDNIPVKWKIELCIARKIPQIYMRIIKRIMRLKV